MSGRDAPARAGPFVDRDAVRFLATYYRPRAGRLALFVLGASAQSLLVLPVLAQVRLAFDDAIPRGDVPALVRIGAAVLGLRLLGSAVAIGLRAWILTIIKGAVADMRRDLASRLYRLSREFLGRADSAQLQTRLVQDSERVDHLGNALFSGLLPALASAVVLAASLVALDWRLVMLALPLLPLLWLSGWLSGRFVKREVRTFQRAFEGFSRSIQFGLRYMDLTRLKAFESHETARQHAALDTLRDTSRRMAMSYALHGQLQRTVTGLAGVVILVVGGVAVVRGRLTLGQLVQFYVAAGMLHGYVDTVLAGVPEVIAGQESAATLGRLFADGDEEPYRGTAAVDFDGAVEFDRVRFSYGREEVLRGVALRIPRGANIAVTGANGAGKSTLLHLLAGFYRPTAGRLLASGVPYDALDMPALRRRIGVVPQHPLFFNGTVRANVTYGAPDCGDDELARALRLSTADAVLARLPAGLDTEMGEHGVMLSGGERQRLAIARALLGAPRLLVLDEPTTHLDAESVRTVTDRLLAWPDRPTLVTISHDASVIARADVVYRLEGGRLSETGVPTAANADVPREPALAAP